MATPLFWTLWFVGILCLGAIFLRGLLRPFEMLGLPFVVVVFSGYFYVLMPFEAAVHLSGYLPPWTLEVGHACALLGIVSLWFGWWLSARRAMLSQRAERAETDRRALFRIGIAAVLVGSLGNWTFDNFNTAGFGESAYWYMLFQVAFPGAAACIIAVVQDRRVRTLVNLLVLSGLVLYLLSPYLLGARRGPTMAWILTISFSLVLGSGRTPSRKSVLLGLGAAGGIALTILASRGFLEHGASVTDAVASMSLEDIAFQKTRQVADNEYVYHCTLIATTMETGRYQYGTGHLGILFHWIPRSMWPDKPVRGAGLFPDPRALMPAVTGITMGRGMAAGGFADAFVQYGFLFPLFWVLFGWAAGTIWVRALRPDDWFWKVTLVNVLSCAHWLVAQSVVAFAVPLLFGQMVPLIGLLYVRHVNASASRVAWRPWLARR
jgi:hypothetical protein